MHHPLNLVGEDRRGIPGFSQSFDVFAGVRGVPISQLDDSPRPLGDVAPDAAPLRVSLELGLLDTEWQLRAVAKAHGSQVAGLDPPVHRPAGDSQHASRFVDRQQVVQLALGGRKD
jgi:hypothetical protein